MKRLLIGNWKMHLTASETVAYLRDLLPRLAARDDREIVVAPPFTSLAAARSVLGEGPVRLAAQDVFWEEGGAYTGEIAPLMLQDLGVTYVIIGHSERRLHLGETDLMVSRKVRAALQSDLRPVVCVGEQEAARASGRAAAVVRSQLLRSLEEVPPPAARRLAISYEPIWAIGTGKAAHPSDASEMHALVRSELSQLFGEGARDVRILYGGSVTPGNIDALMAAPYIDGVLVGGASLDAAQFARIVAFGDHS